MELPEVVRNGLAKRRLVAEGAFTNLQSTDIILASPPIRSLVEESHVGVPSRELE